MNVNQSRTVVITARIVDCFPIFMNARVEMVKSVPERAKMDVTVS